MASIVMRIILCIFSTSFIIFFAFFSLQKSAFFRIRFNNQCNTYTYNVLICMHILFVLCIFFLTTFFIFSKFFHFFAQNYIARMTLIYAYLNTWCTMLLPLWCSYGFCGFFDFLKNVIFRKKAVQSQTFLYYYVHILYMIL
jgi:hypothetical protein